VVQAGQVRRNGPRLNQEQRKASQLIEIVRNFSECPQHSGIAEVAQVRITRAFERKRAAMFGVARHGFSKPKKTPTWFAFDDTGGLRSLHKSVLQGQTPELSTLTSGCNAKLWKGGNTVSGDCSSRLAVAATRTKLGRRAFQIFRWSSMACYLQIICRRPVADHMKSVVFAGEGETLTHIQGERNWIAAAGFKGSRMFYRKAILACGGRVWHHVAFEYPPEIKARVDRFILLAAEGLNDSQTDCDEAVVERQR
jgi:hypothetical protein